MLPSLKGNSAAMSNIDHTAGFLGVLGIQLANVCFGSIDLDQSFWLGRSRQLEIEKAMRLVALGSAS
jgi:hypothetical protein